MEIANKSKTKQLHNTLAVEVLYVQTASAAILQTNQNLKDQDTFDIVDNCRLLLKESTNGPSSWAFPMDGYEMVWTQCALSELNNFSLSAPMESRELVLEAVRQRWDALQTVGEVWRSDREVVLAAVRHNGLALAYAAEVLKRDREIVLAA
eukprot:5752366-Amphidinium_carterae.1